MRPYTIINADCLKVRRHLNDNSVDSIVCDPPYGLGFMGKNWDHAVPGPVFWERIMRVAKPGAYLVAFGGTRTYHRLICAIEDAGWEIRDCIMWVCGSGFPKSVDIPYTIGQKVGLCRSSVSAPHAVLLSKPTRVRLREGKASIALASARILPEGAPAVAIRIGEGAASSGRTATSWCVCPVGMSLSTESSGKECWAALSRKARLFITKMATGVTTAGRTSKFSNAVSTLGGTIPVHNRSAGCVSAVVVATSGSTDDGTSMSVIPTPIALDSAIEAIEVMGQYQGYGSSLKPAWEPIIVARKPLIGTVAANVLEHGTGGINIDGCRIGPGHQNGRGKAGQESEDRRYADRGSVNIAATPGPRGGDPQGRWPANLIHDGSDEVVGLFPQGKSTVGRIGKKSVSGVNIVPAGQYRAGDPGFNDSGSAARFFFCAKASRSERDAGCESFHKMTGGEVTGCKDGSAGTKSPRARAGGITGGHNTHPTVKPLALMRWLCRLVTPPDGLILDPFTGSGTTGVAALHEGFGFVGIELSEEYTTIANARLRAAWKAIER